MEAKKARQLGFTHSASTYGINGYAKFFPDGGVEFRARWWLTDKISIAITDIDSYVIFHNEGFRVKVWDTL